MGTSTSKINITQKDGNITINKSDINALNDYINNTIVNLIVTNAKQCSSAIIQHDKIEITHIVADESLNLTSTPPQPNMVNFACAQNDAVKGNIDTVTIGLIMTRLYNNIDSSIITTLNKSASTKTDDEWKHFGWGNHNTQIGTNTVGSSFSNTADSVIINSIIEKNMSTMTTKDINAVMLNAFTTNFTTRIYNDCLTKIINMQEFFGKDVTTGKNITLTLNIDSLTATLLTCIQNSGIASGITKNFTDFLDITVDDQHLASSTSTSENILMSSKESFLSNFGHIIQNILAAFLPFPVFPQSPGFVGSSTISLMCIICILIMYLIYRMKNSNKKTD